jgi:hypothetical protein
MPSKYVSRQCQRCEKGFQTTQSEVNKGKGRFCGSTCAAFTRQEATGPLKCSQCGAARSITARKENGMCRKCAARSWSRKGRNMNAFGRQPVRAWAFASDSAGAKAERAKVYLETEDRPRLNPLVKLGSQTQWGKVAAVGMREGERYYCLLNADTGVVSMMPADVVEGR